MNKFQRLFFYFIGTWCFLCVSLRCAMNIAGMQSAKTVGERNKEFTFSSSYTTNSPYWQFIAPDNGDDRYELSDIPNLEFDSKFGVTERFDFGLSASTVRLGFDTKFNLLNNEDKLYLSFGGGAGLGIGGKYLKAQLFTSYHFSEKIAVYCSPTYILTYFSSSSYSTFATNNLDLYGASLGLLLGKQRQLGLDLGLFTLWDGELKRPMVNLGLGYKFFKIKKSSIK